MWWCSHSRAPGTAAAVAAITEGMGIFRDFLDKRKVFLNRRDNREFANERFHALLCGRTFSSIVSRFKFFQKSAENPLVVLSLSLQHWPAPGPYNSGSNVAAVVASVVAVLCGETGKAYVLSLSLPLFLQATTIAAVCVRNF